MPIHYLIGKYGAQTILDCWLILLFVAWTVKILQRFQTRCSVHENTLSWTLFSSSRKIPATPSSEGILFTR